MEYSGNHFEMLLSGRDALLQPEVHDLLLVDDSKYTKSKHYFWAINILREIDSDIAAVISQLRGFMDFSETSLLHRYYPLPNGEMSEDREKIVVRTLTILLEDLLNLQARFKGQREIAIALRDGMFNASAVMETRASTRLGENINLLTFVRLFYLPLSFTMSLWSINNSALAHVDIVTGVTIILAANGDEKWKRRGDDLTETVFANEQNGMPSSWYVVQYVCILVWKWFTAIVTRSWQGVKQIYERLVNKKAEQTQQRVCIV
ncbi:b08116a8-e3e5-428c-bf08-08a0eff7e653 [Sclerotinia trifoliorum]|uniref:B08116a8-e3e5-428c-bf08-08a0eff7e653 n=1 Tax=Sclerotinia trifoliorum TaxID=28548 RepID=A0A8H2ZNN5_9HELO|nr:b08116a8-e3e5-428c-bf08-08a0eff7e653 [Sclerotinia trifoliorum]